MAFTSAQSKALKAKLGRRHVKQRFENGQSFIYIEGWHAIAEANRIFGHEHWDRQTLPPHCLWSSETTGETRCLYSTKVRITVRAGGDALVREGIGTGYGSHAAAHVAHELAIKAAETDATKRALATFGNPFGLALYDRELRSVSGQGRPHAKSSGFVLRTNKGSECFKTAAAFNRAFLAEVSAAATIMAVHACWVENVSTLAQLHGDSTAGKCFEDIVRALKVRLKAIVATNAGEQTRDTAREIIQTIEDQSADAASSAYRFPKEKRLRDRAHLAFVASQPCLVCGRRPSQAHHLRFAQPRAMGLKVSDEFTLPLCNTHHDALHRTGDERAWWARHGIIEPLKYAARLWAASRQRIEQQGHEQMAIAPPGKDPRVGDEDATQTSRPALAGAPSAAHAAAEGLEPNSSE